VSRCTHRKPQRQGRKTKDTDRVVIEEVFLASIGLPRSNHVPSSSRSSTHVAAPAPPHRISPRRSASFSIY
jgi:hypothetical protein